MCRPRKKVFTKSGRLFSPNSSKDQGSDADQSKIIGEDADEDHTQIIGGDTVKINGGIYPPNTTLISAPLPLRFVLRSFIFHSNFKN